LLHVFGLLYMFVAIAIVCDECFVPALEVITEVLELSPDVAGATFMAAGGSAPEFFTSLIGAMITSSSIGTGTIIGSAVFNVLFVIGACALVAPGPLELTWFPLARDSSFYFVDLIVVTVVFLDDEVRWYEALILLFLYILYTTFMAYSERVEAWIRDRWGVAGPEEVQPEAGPPEDKNQWAISREKVEGLQDCDVATAGTGDTGEEAPERRNIRIMRSGSSVSVGDPNKKQFRHHSMRHGHATVTNVQHLDSGSTGGSGDAVGESGAEVVVERPEIVPEEEELPPPAEGAGQPELTGVVPSPPDAPAASSSSSRSVIKNSEKIVEGDNEDEEGGQEQEEEEEEDKPLSIFPPGAEAPKKDWAYYLCTIPIVFLLVITIPDVRRAGWRKYFVVTFIMSILWIAGFTWAMVWFGTVISETAGMGEVVMGLTILAAGTSVPDMLTSMLVARDGHGDMAISSSIGSNIFDVTVGLPVPWLLYTAHRRRPIQIVNQGLEISVMLLLVMLAFTIGTIKCHHWVMTRWMGGSMLLLYVVFIAVSVGLSIHIQNGGSLKLIHV